MIIINQDGDTACMGTSTPEDVAVGAHITTPPSNDKHYYEDKIYLNHDFLDFH